VSAAAAAAAAALSSPKVPPPPSSSTGTRVKRSCGAAECATPPAPGGHRNARYTSSAPSPRMAVSIGRSCARAKASTRSSTTSGAAGPGPAPTVRRAAQMLLAISWDTI